MRVMYCGWKGYLVCVEPDKGLLDLYALRQQQQQQGVSGKWILNRELEVSQETIGNACVRACEVVLDENSGTKKLFLVLSHPQSSPMSAALPEPMVFRLLEYSHSRRKLLNYGEPLPITAAAVDLSKVAILDGPVVVWSEGHQLKVVYAASNRPNTIPLQQAYILESLIADQFHLEQVMDVWPFLWEDETTFANPFDIYCISKFVVFLKLKVASTADASLDGQFTVEWVCLLFKLSSVEEGLAVSLLRESEFVPREYGCISSCVTLYKSYAASSSSGDVSSRNQFLVGTEYCQVVLLQKGVPLQFVELKYVPYQISLIDVSLESQTTT